jgi:hypothetical protein
VLTWTPFIEQATIAQETTHMQRRDDLEIRSLLEFPALRAALGLDTPTVSEEPAEEPVAGRDMATAVTQLVGAAGGQSRKRQPKRSSKAASAPRASKGTATRAMARAGEKQHPRFDRRALLESDRVA